MSRTLYEYRDILSPQHFSQHNEFVYSKQACFSLSIVNNGRFLITFTQFFLCTVPLRPEMWLPSVPWVPTKPLSYLHDRFKIRSDLRPPAFSNGTKMLSILLAHMSASPPHRAPSEWLWWKPIHQTTIDLTFNASRHIRNSHKTGHVNNKT